MQQISLNILYNFYQFFYLIKLNLLQNLKLKYSFIYFLINTSIFQNLFHPRLQFLFFSLIIVISNFFETNYVIFQDFF